jgi:hypothetical protein
VRAAGGRGARVEDNPWHPTPLTLILERRKKS